MLTPLLLARFSDLDVTWAPVAEADMLVVGSIIDMLPDDGSYKGKIVGTGVLRPTTDARARLKTAQIYALRGPLTACHVPGSYALGDAGILANELASPDKLYNLSLLPHWLDKELEHRFTQWSPHIIHADDGPLEVITQIGASRKLVTSSLHGLVIADAFGVHRRLEYSPVLDREGGQHKFLDWHAALHMPFELGKTARPSQRRVEDMQSEMFDAFEAIGDDIRAGV
jgi:hypothetical protein